MLKKIFIQAIKFTFHPLQKYFFVYKKIYLKFFIYVLYVLCLKVILDEKEVEIEYNKNTLLGLQSALDTATKTIDLKSTLSERLIDELNRVELSKHQLEVEKMTLREQLGIL